jgi:hypothetical protein
VLGGRISLESKSGDEGRLRCEAVSLDRLVGALHAGTRAARLDGTIDLEFMFRGPVGEPITGKGKFAVTHLRCNDSELSDLLLGDLILTGESFRLKDVSGPLAAGMVLGEVGWNFRNPERSWFRINLDRVETEQLLSAWPELGSGVRGQADIQVHGRLGREWRGNGELSMPRGEVLGIDLVNWRLPVDFVVSPESGRGELIVRESHGQAAHGQAQGDGRLTWGDELRLDGKIRFYGVNLRQLVRSWQDTSQVAGELSGRLDLSGSSVRSVDDLTASLEATLDRGQVLDLPLFRQLAPYIAPGQSLSAFHSGEVKARLARQVIHVDRLTLRGTVAQASMTGTVTTQGRLNLEATVNPGLTASSLPVVRQFAGRMPDSAPRPLSLVNQASTLLTARLIHLRIGGTFRNPSLRLVPLPRLTEDTLRFFLSFQ